MLPNATIAGPASRPPPHPLRKHRDGVWIKECWVRFVGFVLQARMVVLELRDGLLLYSPCPTVLDASTLDELRALGKPRWLVAPNEIHNLGLRTFQGAFPEAHTTGCPGHPRRVPGVRFDQILDPSGPQDAVPWTGTGELRFHVIGGNAFLHEIAVLHVPSRTLLLADAVEYIDRERHLAGRAPVAMMWLMQRLGFTFGAPCMSPEHHLYCSDPDALEASLQAIEAWDFDSQIISHGRVLEGGEARQAVARAFRATIGAARRRWPATRSMWAFVARFQ